MRLFFFNNKFICDSKLWNELYLEVYNEVNMSEINLRKGFIEARENEKEELKKKNETTSILC